MQKFGLVLEGGGMRGVFTSGVLDCFMDNSLFVKNVFAVSAGSSNALSYLSLQRGRAKFCNIDALAKYRYIGLRYMFTQRCIMDYDFLFGALPKKVYPYDFRAYLNSLSEGANIEFSATDCRTGRAHYFRNPRTMASALLACRASCSMPFLCPMVEIGSGLYLDGGISDPIPVERAISRGFQKNIVVLTRNEGYRKHENLGKYAKIFYRKYPELVGSIYAKDANYNRELELCERLARGGEAFIIRPQKAITVDRLGRNPRELLALYAEGYACAKNALPELRKFCVR